MGDFNGDDRQDLAVANYGSANVSILLGNGAGSFGAATNFGVGTSRISVAVGIRQTKCEILSPFSGYWKKVLIGLVRDR